jgi:hypothetical protein
MMILAVGSAISDSSPRLGGERIREMVPPAGLEPATRGLGIHRNPSQGVNCVPCENQYVSEIDHLCSPESLHITAFVAQYGNKMATNNSAYRYIRGGEQRKQRPDLKRPASVAAKHAGRASIACCLLLCQRGQG